ncbi:uncharacterized protein LOC109403153 [Aedes albopictus]|uniref:Integrase catalytic domain-containing protein n=1 Tax=Aedes albopictus TaxID=7160 RepID=A0ABM1ZPA2_AEDAL
MTDKKIQIICLYRTFDAIRDRSKKLLSFVEKFSSKSSDLDELEEKLSVVDDLRGQFLDTRSKLYGLVKDEDLADIQEHGEEIEDILDKSRYKIRRQLKIAKPPTKVGPDVKPESETSSSKSKLPDIPLPKFDGHYENWIYFRDQFKSIICRRENLDDFEKLHYLRMCLCGEAKHLQCNEETFASLWDALNRRYENKRWLVEKHLGDLFQIPHLTSENAAGLRSMLDSFLKHIRALNALGIPLDKMSELIFAQMVMMRLHPRIRREYEAELEESKLPEWKELVIFLENHCRMLENLECLNKSCAPASTSRSTKSFSPASNSRTPSSNRPFAATATRERSKISCFLCRQNHYINQCEEFLKLSPPQRIEKAKSLNLCFNCLSNNHSAAQCTRSLCRSCQKKHHTLLHLESKQSLAVVPSETIPPEQPKTQRERPSTEPSVSNTIVSQACRAFPIRRQVLLNTAIIYVEDALKEFHKVRVLLDSGSMVNFITEDCIQRLGLKKIKGSAQITGVCDNTSSIQYKVRTVIRSTTSNYETEIECLVTKKITADLPIEGFDTTSLMIPNNLTLADPSFNVPNRIDVLIGADVYMSILESNRVPLHNGSPVMQETLFGWVIGGRVEAKKPLVSAFVSNENLDLLLRSFWDTESCGIETGFTTEEDQAEQHFVETHRRQEDGRYMVELPFKKGCPDLGDSKQMALKRLQALDRRLMRNWNLATDYADFINEYISLGHMVELGPLDQYVAVPGQDYFLPHHAVEKPDSSTTKCRVVFDGSAVSSNGKSLNENLLVGPVIQPKLNEIALRFRVPKIAFTTDIGKMYRQVHVSPNHQQFQQILWTPKMTTEPIVYRLTTVTYGLASAPFQAVRAVKQLCIDEAARFPEAARVVVEDSYIDDILTGADTLEQAVRLKDEIIGLFDSGKFELHKWCSNSSEFLQTLPQDKIEKKLMVGEKQSVKALGIVWKPDEDVFMLNVDPVILGKAETTKREILSSISRFFDPIGLAGPITIVVKLIMQSLWKKEKGWDEEADQEDIDKWVAFKSQLASLQQIKVSRCILPFSSATIQIHGFCDASNLAYGACVYVRSTNENGQVNMSLVCSRSRVAPIKKASKSKRSEPDLTIPRLELCGALLLAQLVTDTLNALNIRTDKTVLWSDSTIALAWIARRPEQLKQFVANRVTKIQALTSTMEWRHVGTNDNPADIISRGLMPNELQNAKLWWNGPEFLQAEEPTWPTGYQEPEEVQETVSVCAEQPAETFPIFENISSYRRMVRVMVWLQRFISILKKEVDVPKTSFMSLNEKTSAVQQLVKLVQREAYPDLVRQLQQGKMIDTKHKLISLSPFIDDQGVLRVGGRLRNKTCNFDMKHQYILPPYHKFTEAIIREYHRENMHSGNQLTLSMIREKFWIERGKSAVKRFSCLRCFRQKPKPLQQYMGELPTDRVELVYPFYNTGVDFCGPVYLKPAIRSTTRVKSYICVFVCQATKAIHLELVGSLTSVAFIGALQRFVSRRGKCAKLISDNATNFVGANNDLKELHELFNSQPFLRKLQDFTEEKAIQWIYIPPRAPSFGGLWEAGVRSLKHHLCRTLGEAILTFEEMTTVLTRIEATLNSRPLCALSDDPTDYNALTPGHFLIFRPLNAVAEPDLTSANMHSLSRWDKIKQYVQHFWRRWNVDYIHQLQQRSKWHTKVSVEVGQLVIVREDNVPPQQWLLGRIEELFPGKDDIVRVVTVRTARGVYKRSVSRLSLLPIKDNDIEASNHIG